MSWTYRPFILASLVLQIFSHPYDSKLANYNININQAGGNKILSYSSDWPEKSTRGGYTPSPTNWRALPTYTVLLDKFVDGDPTNNDYFNTQWEWDSKANQLRHGGDISGFAQDRVLDYIYGMGYRCIFFAGTPWINMPWQADGYSALDFTLLDPHYGTLAEWRAAIDKIHARGMYVMLDMTTTTMGDLIGNSKSLNASTPFSLQGYEVEWKYPPHTPWDLQRYADFNFTNTRSTCQLPNFYDNDGSQITSVPRKLDGCYAGDFDQFGDIEAFGVHPDWQRQLSKFASVQDRLREWDDGVAAKLEHLACMTLKALDPDSIRIDKATQQTVDFVGKWGGAVKTCAASIGKNNFFIPGEITGGNTFGSLYIGRGRQPKNYANIGVQEASLIQANQSQHFMRPVGQNGLDSAAFHYSVYRSLTRFLSMDGNLDVAYDVEVNWASAWNQIFVSNDFLNHHTGQIDPRHLYGTSNQDVFRWPSLKNGTAKLLLGQLITNLVMPGIPLAYYGEEQDMYLYDSQASNYLYGRQAMSATRAWQTHGCYRVGSQQYYKMPLERALTGCQDEWNSLDHFDPTSPVRKVLSHFTHLRAQYPALQDGFNLAQRGNWTSFGQLPGSNMTQTEWGFWSVTRSPSDQQQFTGPNGNTTVWMLYSNLNTTKTFEFDCGTQLWISAPYPAPLTVRNLIYPYETYNLAGSKSPYYLDGKAPYRGCLQSVTMDALGFKVLVPADNWVAPLPQLVHFTPGHDARILSRSDTDSNPIAISLSFSDEMSCQSVSESLSLAYVIDPASSHQPRLNVNSATCTSIPPVPSSISSAPAAVWTWSSQIEDAPDGIYELIIKNPTNKAGLHTQSTDHLLIRKGSRDNPIAFQTTSYSKSLLQKGSDGLFQIFSNAAGADLMRYSTDFGKTWMKWQPYARAVGLPAGSFSQAQFWEGNHIRVQYWSKLAGSAAQTVDSDYGYSGTDIRTVPQLLLRGPFNQWGYDLGTNNGFTSREGNWTFDIMTNWPNFFQVTPFDVHDELYYGDVDGDGALDLLPPNTQAPNYLNLSKPLSPYLGWRIMVNQTDMTWSALPIGDETVGILIFILLCIIPPVTAVLACWIFRRAFYSIKINKYGFKEKKGFRLNPFLASMKEKSHEFRAGKGEKSEMGMISAGIGAAMGLRTRGARWPDDMTVRRKVLIATLEYEITDWKLKVKIGGLGVMSSLMGKAMHDVDLLWVVPKVKDLEYPEAEPAPPIEVTIFGEKYLIELQIHRLDNITYYLLDSPVFRANTKSDPYPARMDDLSSAIFYSSWNQSIAEICRRTPDLDIYHINDYHGALVPLYLLPMVLPVCLSLHNAEFQGLWPLRTKEEADEVCRAFNLSKDICTKYVQFGNVFNLLHAAASFISHHQKSVGVAGVSDKYGKRSWARYPALWTLKTIDSLPNPDPTDIEALDAAPRNMKDVTVDEAAEAQRPEDKRKTQEWAGLHQDPKAQLFVFVGRWSLQKGVDLIADVFTTILEKRSDVQLVAVGPVVDLYGRFAAAKLARLMELHPGRVFSKPEFTALPPFIFSGGDFALIPSRDEPFGLVAVEFGRKGALGVGSRLGGLGLMPGWWFPVESDSTAHMHSQFAKTIKAALKSTNEERAVLRARSALQRFPVLEWRSRMENMHRRSIKASRKYAGTLAAGPDIPVQPQSDMKIDMEEFRSDPFSTRGSMDSFRADHSEETITDFTRHSVHLRPSRSPVKRNGSSPTGTELNTSTSPHSPRTSDGYDSEGRDASPLVTKRGARDSRVSHEMDRPMDGKRISVAPSLHPNYNASQEENDQYGSFLTKANRQLNRKLTKKLTITYGRQAAKDPFIPGTATPTTATMTEFNDEELLPPVRPFAGGGDHSKRKSFDSINSIMEEHGAESPLNQAIEGFTDENGQVTQEFIAKLAQLNSANSKGDLCIAEYLVAAEKAYFKHVRDDKLALARSQFDGATLRGSTKRPISRAMSEWSVKKHALENDEEEEQTEGSDEPLATAAELNQWQIRLQKVYFGWPVYTILLAFGQVLGATSFQLSLLGGSSSQRTFDLYIIGAVNIIGSVTWYILNSVKPATWSLSLPWVCFGMAFFLIGLPSLSPDLKVYSVRHPLSLLASSFYSFASAAGFLFFSTNFGEEAGGGTDTWVYRACVVQGTQQIWIAALWYWGFKLQGTNPTDTASVPPAWINAFTLTLAITCFGIGYVLYIGLPNYYRNLPGQVPNFVKTLFRRKLVIWYMAAEILRDYWLSGPYGRNWSFLWTGSAMPVWATVILVFIFFVVVWAVVMKALSHASKKHTWFLPIFAVGLGAPRWCQMLWGTSSLATYIPWAGAAGPYLGTSLWLWLGVLDAVQGVGLGMILLQTLSRTHVAATLCLAQIIGSTAVIAARATAPNRIGPGNVFPDLGLWDRTGHLRESPLANWEFWVALACQLIIVAGYLVLFRREQLSKP
ncbi:Cell wall alpha-1,3-glucan synthase ags1 [Puccinia graminis f. sp. tritici]|uniref:alpha-1,3-glucan synthase n=1 Tax=Puccinia graminis f. sp. tritici TaxID=56615 RepID=A0A5B0MN12_PUCGR|nr:Cell wall alpha-1,3-glucan synthase ags1 [Puccinia graminis f. sp. tritici]